MPRRSSEDDDMPWKAKRRLESSRRPHEAGPQLSPEERAAKRLADRKAAAADAPQEPRRRQGQARGRHRHAGRRARRQRGQGPPGHRRLRQGREIDHGQDRHRPPPPHLREGHPPLAHAARARREQRGRRGRRGPRSSRPARSRRPSAGAWSTWSRRRSRAAT